MGLINSIENLLKKNKFTGKFISQYGFRTLVFSTCSFIFNAAYAVLNVVIAVLNSSVWYGALSFYYLSLAFMRGSVLYFHIKKRKGVDLKYGEEEYGIVLYGRCGLFLTFLHLGLPAAVTQMVLNQNPMRYTRLMVYASAVWAFYKIVMAIVNMYKSKRKGDMTTRALRSVNLAEAIISLLVLQMAMLKEFAPEYNATRVNALASAAVSIFTVALGIYMIITAKNKRKSLKGNTE